MLHLFITCRMGCVYVHGLTVSALALSWEKSTYLGDPTGFYPKKLS